MKNIRRVLLTLCMITCFFALTACSSKEVVERPLSEAEVAEISSFTERILREDIVSVSAEEIDDAIARADMYEQYAYSSAFTTWKNLMEDTGALVEITGSDAHWGEDGLVGVVQAQFEKRAAEFTVYYDEENGQPTSMSLVAEYTMGENMTKAALNTLMGMGTVFLVLIFISFLIYCFKFINQFEKAMKGGGSAAPAPAPAPVQAAPAVEEELTDDLELVAVITAAIAASTGASADGLVVRSIKRAGTSKWKRA